MISTRRIWADLKVTSRGFIRSRIGLFFSLIFPVILILLFGAIFAGTSGATSAYVQNLDGTPLSSQFITSLNSTKALTLTPVPATEDLSQYLLSHSSSDGIIVPQGFQAMYLAGEPINVTVYGNPASSASAIVSGVTQEVVNAYNLGRANTTEVIGVQSLTIKSNPKYIDFLIPGLIGFSVLTAPMFATVNITSEYKRDKLFKQLSLTPLTKGEWLFSKILWYWFVTVISFILMCAVGIYLFGADITLTAAIIPFLLVGPVLFVSLGMLVGTVSNSPESAAVVGNLITFPMMFLAGTFFPVATMPHYLQMIAHFLPLYYVIDGLNNVMTYNNLSAALIDLGVLLVISAITFALAVYFFKWRED
ncbi:MAG: ABC transporter permease [Conexivisphaerales archaeon]